MAKKEYICESEFLKEIMQNSNKHREGDLDYDKIAKIFKRYYFDNDKYNDLLKKSEVEQIIDNTINYIKRWNEGDISKKEREEIKTNWDDFESFIPPYDIYDIIYNHWDNIKDIDKNKTLSLYNKAWKYWEVLKQLNYYIGQVQRFLLEV